MSLICIDQKVLLKKDNSYKIVVVKENTNAEIDRTKFKLSSLIGCAFGSSFTIDRGNLVKCGKSSYDQFEKEKVEEMLGTDDLSTVNLTRDNRHVDGNKRNQLLSADEIDQMKKNGASGQVILDTIIENSASFASKTTFAQEKYLNKKKKRYLPTISVHRITTRMLCELYAARNKLKIMNLRIDSVSQILSYANVQHDSRTMIAETCAGLLLGSVVERGAKVVNFYHGSAPVLPENYSEWRELDDIVYNLPLAQLVPLALTGRMVKHMSAEGRPSEPDTTEEGGREPKRQRLAPETVALKREERERRRSVAQTFLAEGPVDGLIVATRYHPSKLTLQMLKFLAPGKPLVVYCQFLAPLVDLYDDLRKAGGCCGLRISESWLRSYQVLPERTHPEMSMSGTGGYLLVGIKLNPE